MTQNEKDLLLKDLCGRLIYGVKVGNKIPISQNEYKEIIGKVTSVHYDNSTVQMDGSLVYPIIRCKPYLFPLSSMTEEQNLEYLSTCRGGNKDVPTLASFEWCDRNHFDYRGLIPMGLANDATDKNIY